MADWLYGITDGVTAKNSRLIRNAVLQKYPQNQRQWQSFIVELSKWTRDEEGQFAVTFDGFSTDPTNSLGGELVCTYHVYGKVVFLQFDFAAGQEGTSDQTYFRITNLPDSLKPQILQQGFTHFGHDASTNTVAPIVWRVHPKVGAPTTYDIDFLIHTTASNGLANWTNSGTKGFVNEIQIVYSLWDATL